ncbi:hypothetical protein GUJ93_ZPchr0012g21450 [Zizania palustris]|uniref:AT-hook motif nuclear-localized protein n=1 Tax=Zizania palustris TaxID=103762 RepID=A0A8J5WQD3_ZIZPA|nr:hypothetical protein GUJ93_ZPchr0012g21450 [Zizania palustris]
MSAEKTTPLQPQPLQRGSRVCLADKQDSATAYKKGVAYQMPVTLPATSSPHTGPVGGNSTNPTAVPVAAGPLKRKHDRTVVYDAVPLAIVPPSPPTPTASSASAAAARGAGALSVAAPTQPRGFSYGPVGGRAKRQPPPPRAPPTSDVGLLRKRALPLQKEAGGSVMPVLKNRVIKVQTGEDIVSKLMSFCQNGCALYVLSANGDVSNVTLHQAVPVSCSAVNYEV